MMNRFAKYPFYTIFILVMMMLSSCGSMRTNIKVDQAIADDMHAATYRGALNEIVAAKVNGDYEEKDRVLYFLDIGAIYHYMGKYDSSNYFLEQADQAMDDLFTKSISSAATSLLLNDNALDYWGEDYENVYVNVFKALNYIHLKKYEEAMVEARRVHIKLEELNRKYEEYAEKSNESEDKKVDVKLSELKMFDNALARYISFSLYRSEGNNDDADIDRRKIEELYTDLGGIYNNNLPSFISADNAFRYKSPFQVMAFTGLAPKKYGVSLRIRSFNGGVQIWEGDTENKDSRYYSYLIMPGVESGYYIKFELPEIEVPGSAVAGIQISVDNQVIGNLQLLENLQRVAEHSFATHQSMIYFKSISRSIVKSILAKIAKDEIKKQSAGSGIPFLGEILAFGVDVGVDASENADLRHWSTMPGFAWVGEFDVAPGKHVVKVIYLDKYGNTLNTKIYPNVVVNDTGLNLLQTQAHF